MTISEPRDGQLHSGSADGEGTPFSQSSTEEKSVDIVKKDSGKGIQTIDWDGPCDPANPHNFSKPRKWMITIAAITGTLLVPLNGTSITVASHEIAAAFNVSDSVFPNTYWTVASWSLGGALFILVGLPMFEDLGVRLGYMTLYVFFILMIIPQAFAQNFATLVITRFFSGGCVTLLANAAASIIPDIWDDERARSLPVGIWILCYLGGSTLGPPIFAGVLSATGNWRWIFYAQLILYGALFPFFYFAIRETRGNVILARRARHLRKKTGKPVHVHSQLASAPLWRRLLTAAYRPLYLQFTEPVLMASTLWSGFSFGTVFLFTQSVEQVYSNLYAFTSISCGYIQTQHLHRRSAGIFRQPLRNAAVLRLCAAEYRMSRSSDPGGEVVCVYLWVLCGHDGRDVRVWLDVLPRPPLDCANDRVSHGRVRDPDGRLGGGGLRGRRLRCFELRRERRQRRGSWREYRGGIAAAGDVADV